MRPGFRVVVGFLIAVSISASLPVPAEVPDPPVSLGRTDLLPLSAIDLQRLPPVDVAALLDEDGAASDKSEGFRTGIGLKAGFSTTNSGTWEPLPEGGQIWRVRVRSSGALWLIPGFGTFRLQDGAMLHVYDPTGSEVTGGQVNDDVREHGQLWTQSIAGDELVVELFWPATMGPETPNFDLGTVIHGYRDLGITPPSPNGPCPDGDSDCDIDVICPEGVGFEDQKRGVVFIAYWHPDNGWDGASGTLLNNTAGNCKNYVLSANHVSPILNQPSARFFFNYENPICSGANVAPVQSVLGGQLRAAWNGDEGTDFALFEMDKKPPFSFDAFYNGWSHSAAAPTETWVIHHPNGNPKEISHDSDPAQIANDDNFLLVEDYDFGTTRNGSSGSPLFDQNKRVVGQLYGGGTDCFCDGLEINDWYGRLSRSWEGGGQPSSRLRDWLDPAHTGATAINGKNRPITTICFGTWLKFKDLNWGDAPGGGNGDGAIDPGETLTLSFDLENPGDQIITDVSGTLRSQGPGASVPQPDLTWPDVPTEDTVASNAPHATLQVDPLAACGETLPLDLLISGTGGNGAWNPELEIRLGAPVATTLFYDDIQPTGTSWTQQPLEGTNGWSVVEVAAGTGDFAWFVPDVGFRTDTVLEMPFVTLGSESTLRFRQRFDTENSYGGGALEYVDSVGLAHDAGALTGAGGYQSSINFEAGTNLAGRGVWSGDSGGWQDVEVDLSALAGQTVQLRWRFATDDSGGDVGWWIDDAILEDVSHVCSELAPGEASGPAGAGDAFRIGQSPTGGFDLSWSAPAAGGPPTSYVLYRVPFSASGAGTKSCEAELGSATSAILPTLATDHGFLVVARNGQGEGGYGADGDGVPREPAAPPGVCP